MTTSSTPKLFTPVTLGGTKDPIVLKHRISMAPLTRVRAGNSGVQPDYAATYYQQRATDGGLLIAEATNITASGRGYLGSPGIFNQAQIDAWKPVTDAVHAKGGVIFLQLWHTGRIGHPALQPNGELPVSSSTNMPIDEKNTKMTLEGRMPMVKPRALAADEIPQICEDYRVATENALAAGFDGVEVHAANGYLLEQFLHDGINDRTDQYGGSVENRARFLFQVLDAILKTTPSSKVGIRLSPFGKSFGQGDADPPTTYGYVFAKLSAYDLAYAHVIEPWGRAESEHCPADGATALFRKSYRGVLMTASGYERDSSVQVVESGVADMVAIGRYFISNPDLVKRFERNAKLFPYDASTFYGPDEKGYTDYPTLEEEEAQAAVVATKKDAQD